MRRWLRGSVAMTGGWVHTVPSAHGQMEADIRRFHGGKQTWLHHLHVFLKHITVTASHSTSVLMGTVLEPMTDGAPVKIITASNRMFAKAIIALLTVDHLPLFSHGSSLMLKQMQFLMKQECILMTYMGLLPQRCIVHHWLKEAGKLAEYHFNWMLSMLEMFVWASSVVNASSPSYACRNCSLMCFIAVEI